MLNVRSPLRLALGFALLAALSIAVCDGFGAREAYTPGLGEIMTLTQMRHAKLWLAGAAGNWPLAAYELDELEEGFADAVHFHPTHKTSLIAIAEVLPAITSQPIEDLRAAIAKQDAQAFTRSFDALTAACNSCHRSTSFAFNVVTRPAGTSFSNQEFAPQPEPD